PLAPARPCAGTSATPGRGCSRARRASPRGRDALLSRRSRGGRRRTTPRSRPRRPPRRWGSRGSARGSAPACAGHRRRRRRALPRRRPARPLPEAPAPRSARARSSVPLDVPVALHALPGLPERRGAVVLLRVVARVGEGGLDELLLAHAAADALRPAVELELEPVEVRADVLVHAEVDEGETLRVARANRRDGLVPR